MKCKDLHWIQLSGGKECASLCYICVSVRPSSGASADGGADGSEVQWTGAVPAARPGAGGHVPPAGGGLRGREAGQTGWGGHAQAAGQVSHTHTHTHTDILYSRHNHMKTWMILCKPVYSYICVYIYIFKDVNLLYIITDLLTFLELQLVVVFHWIFRREVIIVKDILSIISVFSITGCWRRRQPRGQSWSISTCSSRGRCPRPRPRSRNWWPSVWPRRETFRQPCSSWIDWRGSVRERWSSTRSGHTCGGLQWDTRNLLSVWKLSSGIWKILLIFSPISQTALFLHLVIDKSMFVLFFKIPLIHQNLDSLRKKDHS